MNAKLGKKEGNERYFGHFGIGRRNLAKKLELKEKINNQEKSMHRIRRETDKLGKDKKTVQQEERSTKQ